MSQEVAVLNYLRRHVEGLTSLDACKGKVSDENGEELVITRLSDRIFKLRKDGYNIVTMTEEYVNKNGRKSTYARYRLVPDPLEGRNENIKIHFYK